MAHLADPIRIGFERLEFSALLDSLLAHVPDWKKAQRPLLYSAVVLYALSGVYTLAIPAVSAALLTIQP